VGLVLAIAQRVRRLGGTLERPWIMSFVFGMMEMGFKLVKQEG